MFGRLKNLFKKMYQDLNAEAFARAIKDNSKAVVIDVRSPGEFMEGHIKGAKNINIMSPTFAQEVAKLDPSKEYYVYCRSGNRSRAACGLMARHGLQPLYNLDMGLIGWKGGLVTRA
ncbi:MAG: rhodanese-like domain-containing protein [Bacteroidetes bacterium]|nr:MAG: rhodanese-like domain-containing protein [Bacteroidota bacterium]